MKGAAEIQVERVFREEHGRILAPLIRILGDFQLAEDVLMEAMAQALKVWPKSGLPDQPAAWIVTCAKNRALDLLRRAKVRRDKGEIVRELASFYDDNDADSPLGVGDDRLRLIFTCCHPALALEAQVALTLRTLGGLSTTEIAHAFLVPEPTMAARLTRAKKKIAAANIPFQIPEGRALVDRTAAVAAVLYLIFNEGYAASSGDAPLRHELCRESIRLTSLVGKLIPADAEIRGLFALMLLHDARKQARFDAAGDFVLLEDQDRSLFDRPQIEHACSVLSDTLREGAVGPYQVQAAVAAVHASAERAEDTNWREIAGLYDVLFRMQPTPVVALNRAVAVAMVDGPKAGLALLADLENDLAAYPPFSAARADLYRRSEQWAKALDAYEDAIARTQSTSDKRFLARRMEEVTRRLDPATLDPGASIH